MAERIFYHKHEFPSQLRNIAMEGSEHLYSPAVPEGRYENITSVQQPPLSTPRKRKNKNKGRFSDEQIKSLESTFESETRLEPRKKVQLAGELGLQPRQVAIWFQNRRARWKSKQIEQEYRTLRDNYENLASQFESLKKEKQSLLIQVHIVLRLPNNQQKYIPIQLTSHNHENENIFSFQTVAETR